MPSDADYPYIVPTEEWIAAGWGPEWDLVDAELRLDDALGYMIENDSL